LRYSTLCCEGWQHLTVGEIVVHQAVKPTPVDSYSQRRPSRRGTPPFVDPSSELSRPTAEAALPLLEATEVANYLGMRPDWVYREVRAGRLPHIRLGRAVRFRQESIEAWLASREREGAARRRP
jgi:excisionase family DNA binding protein